MEDTLLKSDNYYTFKIYESVEEIANCKFMHWGQYLYCFELDGDKAVKIGYTADIHKRFRDLTRDSRFEGKMGRVGILGPIRDGLNVEDYIHNLMTPYLLTSEYGNSIEVYSFEHLCETFHYEKINALDTFINICFPIIQSLCKTKYDDDGNYIGYDLILEDINYKNVKRKESDLQIVMD